MPKPEEDCEWCEGKKDCPILQPDSGRRPGYACTRESGHRGKHVACLPFDHAVVEWDVFGIEVDE